MEEDGSGSYTSPSDSQPVPVAPLEVPTSPTDNMFSPSSKKIFGRKKVKGNKAMPPLSKASSLTMNLSSKDDLSPVNNAPLERALTTGSFSPDKCPPPSAFLVRSPTDELTSPSSKRIFGHKKQASSRRSKLGSSSLLMESSESDGRKLDSSCSGIRVCIASGNRLKLNRGCDDLVECGAVLNPIPSGALGELSYPIADYTDWALLAMRVAADKLTLCLTEQLTKEKLGRAADTGKTREEDAAVITTSCICTMVYPDGDGDLRKERLVPPATSKDSARIILSALSGATLRAYVGLAAGKGSEYSIGCRDKSFPQHSPLTAHVVTKIEVDTLSDETVGVLVGRIDPVQVLEREDKPLLREENEFRRVFKKFWNTPCGLPVESDEFISRLHVLEGKLEHLWGIPADETLHLLKGLN